MINNPSQFVIYNIITVAKVTWQNFLSSNKEFRFESNLHTDQLVF